MSDAEDYYREVLTPKAYAVLQEARAEAEAGEKSKAAMYGVKEAQDEESVWACANGLGEIVALMIDDEAITDNNLEALEDLVSDAMAGASGKGQAAGWQIVRELDEEIKQLRTARASLS
jgi:DNA-binding protein YbaB